MLSCSPWSQQERLSLVKHYSDLVTSTRQEGVQNVRNERLYWYGKIKEERAKWQREKEALKREFKDDIGDLKISI